MGLTQTVNATTVMRQVTKFGEAKRLQGIFTDPKYSVLLHSRACALVCALHTRVLDEVYPYRVEFRALP